MNLSKREILISAVLMVNLIFITIPFSFKNKNLEVKIKKEKVSVSKYKTRVSKNPLKSYESFNALLSNSDMTVDEKKAYFSSDSLKIHILTQNDINCIIKFIDSVKEDFSLISCNINKKEPSVLVFEMRSKDD